MITSDTKTQWQFLSPTEGEMSTTKEKLVRGKKWDEELMETELWENYDYFGEKEFFDWKPYIFCLQSAILREMKLQWIPRLMNSVKTTFNV